MSLPETKNACCVNTIDEEYHLYDVCHSCGNLTTDAVLPDGHWGMKYCRPCMRVSVLTGIHISEIKSKELIV